MIKKLPPPCLLEISAYYILRTLPISGGVRLFRGNAVLGARFKSFNPPQADLRVEPRGRLDIEPKSVF
jgi:hypothetical protein